MERALCVCTLAGGCVGITDGVQGEILVSLETGAVQVYNVEELRMVCSWWLPSCVKLCCAAILLPHSHTYYAIGSDQCLLEWSREDRVVKNSSTELCGQEKVAKLLCCGQQLVVVYENGQVESVGTANRCLLAPRKATNWKLSMAAVSYAGIVCVVGMEKGVSVAIAKSVAGRLDTPFTTQLQPKRTDLVSSCLCQNKLLLLFETGEVMMCVLEPPLVGVPCAGMRANPSAGLHLLPVSGDYFALAGEHRLQLWEACYFTCQQQVNVDISANSKVWCVGGCVYWSTSGGQLHACKVEGGRATLSAALGKRQLPPATPFSSLHSWPFPSCAQVLASSEKAVVSSQDYLNSLMSRSKTPHLQAFMATFNSQALTPDLCYEDVIERLLREEEFWGREPLSALLQAGLVPSHMDVLTKAIEKEDWELVDACLSHGPAPAESVLVNAVQKCLSLPERVVCSKDHVLLRRELVCKVLCQPFTDVCLQSHLEALPLQVVKELLVFLSEHVCLSSLLSASLPVPYDIVLEWIGLLVDVHFISLTLDQDCRQLLLSLQSSILTQVLCYSRLSILSSYPS